MCNLSLRMHLNKSCLSLEQPPAPAQAPPLHLGQMDSTRAPSSLLPQCLVTPAQRELGRVIQPPTGGCIQPLQTEGKAGHGQNKTQIELSELHNKPLVGTGTSPKLISHGSAPRFPKPSSFIVKNGPFFPPFRCHLISYSLKKCHPCLQFR